jgi:hypothetical protein
LEDEIMRTTVELEASLVEEAKAIAAETGISFAAVIEEALRQALGRRCGPASKRHLKLKTHGHGGLQPGVDLDNTAALLDLMDAPNAAS